MPPASGVSAFSSARHVVAAISSLSFMLVAVEPALRALTKEMLGLEAGFLGSYVRQNSAMGVPHAAQASLDNAGRGGAHIPSADPGEDRVLGHRGTPSRRADPAAVDHRRGSRS